jgi:hypothetical protein
MGFAYWTKLSIFCKLEENRTEGLLPTPSMTEFLQKSFMDRNEVSRTQFGTWKCNLCLQDVSTWIIFRSLGKFSVKEHLNLWIVWMEFVHYFDFDFFELEERKKWVRKHLESSFHEHKSNHHSSVKFKSIYDTLIALHTTKKLHKSASNIMDYLFAFHWTN